MLKFKIRVLHVSYAQSEQVFCKRTEFTGVALHLGVFQGIVKILRKALW